MALARFRCVALAACGGAFENSINNSNSFAESNKRGRFLAFLSILMAYSNASLAVILCKGWIGLVKALRKAWIGGGFKASRIACKAKSSATKGVSVLRFFRLAAYW